MKKIEKPVLESATPLSAAEMNRIHFAGRHSPLSPADLLSGVKKSAGITEGKDSGIAGGKDSGITAGKDSVIEGNGK